MTQDSVSTVIDSAKQALASKNYESAIDLLLKANSDSPNNPEVIMLLGAAHAENKDYPQAMAYFSKAVAISPTARAYFNIAALHNMQGNKTRAVDALKEALKIDPSHTRASQMLSEISGPLEAEPVAAPVQAAPPKQVASIPQPVSSSPVSPIKSSAVPDLTVKMPPPPPSMPGAPAAPPPINGQKKEVVIGKNWPKVIIGGVMIALPSLLIWISWASVLASTMGIIGGMIVSLVILGIFLKWLANSAGAFEIQHWFVMILLTALLPSLLIIKGFDIMAAGWVELKN